MIDPTGTFDDKKFGKLAFENHKKFIAANPFPHIFFYNFLDEKLASSLSDNFPDYDDKISWIARKTENIKKKYQEDDKELPKIFPRV